MASKATRRQFLQTTAATGIGYWVAGGVSAQESNSPNERIAMASIGIGGKGSSDSGDAGRYGDMVAICDVDTGRLEGTGKKFTKAKQYTDFRKLLEEMEKSIDAVTVSTPDHTHAPAALMAMRMGKHCFCQKPLTHTIYEARLMGKVAKEKGVATQMGNQGTAGSGLRKAAAMMRAGRLGTPKEVVVWSNRPIWPQGGPRPEPKDPPEHLKWDLWLGPAAERPYGNGYHPFAWRGWWDFGTGALGDMACHTVNMPYMGLDLFNPTSVQAVTSGHNRDSYPKWSIIDFEFPATDWRPAVKFTWMDGGKRPDPELLDGDKPQGSGCVVIGTKGKLYSGNDYGGIDKLYGDIDDSDDGLEYDKSPGHFEEWVNAIKGGKPARSSFADYAGGLTETILLGNLAVYVAADGEGERVQWDAQNLKVKNISGLENIVKPVYRDGYTLDV
ncbi:MAG: Gfo/Idh/MocA family oxidoreductase [Pirellulales bacterium]|nr:Gfo/Idh/MocA family oxidoreductase [Pirellulales bacterium]